ncbi:NACHT domain-containing protein [Cladophialophora immunda]|nr:NACHT domain-containing protein [Cladophialophora immunda]
MPPTPPPTPDSGFTKALNSFKTRLTASERAQFNVSTLDDLKVTILTIQAEQRQRKKMMHMGRIQSFLEAMEQFGKVIEVFVNTTDMLAFVWGPLKMLLLVASSWSDSFDALLDAYQLIAEHLPIFKDYQTLFLSNQRMQVVLESIWSNILDFHIRALRIFQQSTLRQLFRSLWKDFKSRFQHLISDLQRQKGLVESHANQLHIQQYEEDRLRIFAEFEQAQKTRSEQRFTSVMQWISAAPVIQDHEHFCGIREGQFKDTGKRPGRWILNHPEVQAWLSPQVPKSSILWVLAIPGAGKSILASVIVEELRQTAPDPVAFFYCKHHNPEKNAFFAVMKGLLSHLVAQQKHLVPFYHDEGLESGEVPLQSTKLCKKMLRSMLQQTPKAFLIIDGLDECNTNERKPLLDFLVEVTNLCDRQSAGKIRVLILSRDEPDFKKYLSLATLLRLDSQDALEDIKHYVQHRAGLVKRNFSLNEEDQKFIEHHVLDRTEGMFLYAKLVMEHLERQPSEYDLKIELGRLPTGLDQAYQRNLDRMEATSGMNERAVTRTILSLMICCKRTLRWREIQSAISIDLIDEKVDHSRRLSKHIRDICGSLVEILPGDRIEFVHITAAFYIMESGYIPQFSAEQTATTLCLHYLAFDCFEECPTSDSRSDLAEKGYFAFQDYAVVHWIDHVLALLNPNDMINSIQPGDCKQISDACIIFGDRYSDDLLNPAKEETSFPDRDRYEDMACFPLLCAIWRHAKAARAFSDDRSNEVSLQSLRRSFKDNRTTLENFSKLFKHDRSRLGTLNDMYGTKWFKCAKLSCYFFHEGFLTESSREDHYNRHERPFRCEEEDCPAAVVGFGSLKELEKHKRNMHPGIDKLSTTFARLKKGRHSKVDIAKYPCPRCSKSFATRIECRVHMSVHNPKLAPKASFPGQWGSDTSGKS